MHLCQIPRYSRSHHQRHIGYGRAIAKLPSLLIIPFVLLAGKLAEKRDFIRLLRVGLWLFAASGVLYLFSSRMWQLMAVSALLGIGAGLIIPLSTGFISRYFTGEYRVRQFGYSSALTNMKMVLDMGIDYCIY